MQFTLHTTFPSQLTQAWNDLLSESASHVPFLRYEYLNAWWQTRGGGEWPEAEVAIITAYDGERLVGFAPLFSTRREGKPTLMLLGSVEVSDYLDLICRPEDLPSFASGLLGWLLSPAAPEWQTLDLYNILEGSPSMAALKAAAETHHLTVTRTRLEHSPYITLPGDWETYLSGIDKKQRHEIRRKMRRAEESPTPVTWRATATSAELDGDIAAFLDLMAQDEEKAAFLTEPMREHMRNVMRCAFESGCLHLAFLDVDSKPAAAYLSFLYLNRLWVYNSGLDRAFMEFSPGWVLLGHLLKWANETGISEFDFMRGDEEYKYRFGATDRFIYQLTIQR
jgi:CelD/BcsL family acetyltransferase involved in cellulose biosynthesis